MTSKPDKCRNIITIPQTDEVGSCWFNSILMSILYSQNSRNLLLSNNTLDKNKDKISKIFNQLLKYNYIKHENYEDYFKYMRPEIILKYLNFFPMIEEYKKVIKSGYYVIYAIHKFIKKLNKTSLNLDLFEGKIYGNLNLITDNINFLKTVDTTYYNDVCTNLFEINMRKTDFTTNPDYIIVNPIRNTNINTKKTRFSYYERVFTALINKDNTSESANKLMTKLNLDTYKIKTYGIKSIDNEIIYNGDKYILDSCLLSSYNISPYGGGHAITGITCNNNRYVYNGWMRDIYTKNKKKILPLKRLPCELMKFDWDVNKENDFCLNKDKCKLDELKKKKNRKILCFSFNKGTRSIIYVKVKNINKDFNLSHIFSLSEPLTLPSSDILSMKSLDIYYKRKLKEKLKKEINKKLKKEEEKPKKEEKKEKKEEKKEKKIKNINNFIKKLNETNEINLRLIEREDNYYINSCCDDIADKLALRNPDYIIIEKYNNLTPIKYISQIEYILNLKNYNINLRVNMNDGSILYDNEYKYNIYSRNDDYIIYKLIFKKNNIIKNTSLKMPNKKFLKTKDELNEYIDVIKKSNKNKEVADQLLKIKKFLNIKKLLKSDYIKIIKKIYPYYINLNKYNIDKLKTIYEKECNQIKLRYENYSCFIDSLFVALFNSKNSFVEKFLLNSPLNTHENKNDEKLISYANQIRAEMKLLNYRISSNIATNTCSSLRSSFNKYYDRYKSKINPKYHNVEWINSQNDFSEVIQLLGLIFAYDPILKYSMNNRIEKRSFFDINNYIDVFNNDIIYIKDYYPKYTNTIELDNGTIRKETNEYLAAPILLIQINRIFDYRKKEAKVIPELKLKLKENDLYLNSIIIHYGNETGGHYICLYECKGIWYEFDDMNGKGEIIDGGFKTIIKNDRYTRNIVGLFYISI